MPMWVLLVEKFLKYAGYVSAGGRAIIGAYKESKNKLSKNTEE